MFDWLSPETAQSLGQGVWLTVLLTAVTSIFSLIIGILVAIMRLSGNRLWRGLGVLHVGFHRNVPALVLIILWAFAVPNLFPSEQRQLIFFNNSFVDWLKVVTGLALPYYAFAAALALILNSSAYITELMRAGIGTIPQNQLDAARMLGSSSQIVFWQIVLPQGLRAAFPAISTRLIHTMKNTALAAFVSVPEFFHQTQTAVSQTFRAVEFLTLAAIIYLFLSYLYSTFLNYIDKRLNYTPSIT